MQLSIESHTKSVKSKLNFHDDVKTTHYSSLLLINLVYYYIEKKKVKKYASYYSTKHSAKTKNCI
jgi:hypothetical protein